MQQPNPEGSIAIVGTGRLAKAVFLALQDRIALVVPGRDVPAGSGAGQPEWPLGTWASLAAAQVDILWILTADSSISAVAERLAGLRSWEGVAAVHSSGATPPDALRPLAAAGARIVALHPNGAFAGGEPVPGNLVWSVAPSGPSDLAFAGRLLARLAPRLVPLADAMRPLYHAAAAVASNYAVALFAAAETLYRRAGLGEEMARDVVAGFIASSAERCLRIGPAEALTGPIARGDTAIVEAQRAAIEQHAPELAELFDALARCTERLAHGAAGDQTPATGIPAAQSGHPAAG